MRKEETEQTPNDHANENVICLSEAFHQEIDQHRIPVEREVIAALAHAPGMLDFYMWVVWKSWTVGGGTAHVPLFGDCGLSSQLGTTEYSARRRFRQILNEWIVKVKALWPECPAQISQDGQFLQVRSCRRNPAVRAVGKAVIFEGSSA
jgi:Plasmid encoded RepA protein